SVKCSVSHAAAVIPSALQVQTCSSCFTFHCLCSWDAVCERELETFQECGDTGEICFEEESMIQLIRWMPKEKIPLDASVLDVGNGNGVFLVELVGTFCIHAWNEGLETW
uniref:Uncharacterized protein n=1 Tax=Oryctolagus cuniculus TaxID=9986 RepID=A0A5F9DMS6_RABIT